MKILKALSVIASLAWFAILSLWSGMTLNGVRSAKRTDWSFGTNLMQNIHNDLLANCWCKNALVDINGGWTRLQGRRLCNTILKLDDGRMVEITPRLDATTNALHVRSFYRWCERNGIKFLYVLCPYKTDRQKTSVPIGSPRDFKFENTDDFLAAMSGVPTLDLRLHLACTPEDLKTNFFKTDHHWNFTGAFRAFPIIAEEMLSTLGVGEMADMEQLRPESWHERSFGRPFLGTYGRRTGPYFGGMDTSIRYYIPKFETDILTCVQSRRALSRGSFQDVMLQTSMLQRPRSHYLDSGYSLYGGDTPLSRRFNRLAPVKKRILLIKDSYALPAAAFLSTFFSDVTMIDLRYYRDMSAIQYVAMTRPDLVCVMHNVRTLPIDWKHFMFGDTRCKGVMQASLVKSEQCMKIAPQNNDFNYSILCSKLKPGSKVRLSVDKVSVIRGDCKMVQVILFSWLEHKVIAVDGFVTELDEKQSVYFAVPQRNADYRILLYAGMPGKTAGVSIAYDGISVESLQ